MTTPQKPLPKVPPFLERKTQPRKNSVDTRGMISLATMLVSLSAITVSMLGALKILFEVFDEGLSHVEGLAVKVIVIGFSFIFGWFVGLVSIRGFGNLVYPIIIKIYAWISLAAVGILYIKVMQKLYTQDHLSTKFIEYLTMLLGGLFVVICLHLLVEDHDLRPFAIPPLIISIVHLFVIVYHYVFVANPNGLMLPGDLVIFIVMISISGLMLMHIGILSPLRDYIVNIFDGNGHNGNNIGNGEGRNGAK